MIRSSFHKSVCLGDRLLGSRDSHGEIHVPLQDEGKGLRSCWLSQLVQLKVRISDSKPEQAPNSQIWSSGTGLARRKGLRHGCDSSWYLMIPSNRGTSKCLCNTQNRLERSCLSHSGSVKEPCELIWLFSRLGPGTILSDGLDTALNQFF